MSRSLSRPESKSRRPRQIGLLRCGTQPQSPPIAQRLGEVVWGDVVGWGEVGDGAGGAQDAGSAAHR